MIGAWSGRGRAGPGLRQLSPSPSPMSSGIHFLIPSPSPRGYFSGKTRLNRGRDRGSPSGRFQIAISSPHGLRKGSWTEEEDNLLRKYVDEYGQGNWKHIPSKSGLNRCRKSCRLRWLNYLRPNIKRGHFAVDEDDLIIRLHRLLGNRWSLIAGRIPGRTANDIKNYWNSNLSKKIPSESKNTISLETHNNGTNSAKDLKPSQGDFQSSSDRKTEREWEDKEEEEVDDTTSFWRSLLLEGEFLESNQLRVENKEMVMFEHDDFFQGLGDLVEVMEILGGN